jgi:hypothetical protein
MEDYDYSDDESTADLELPQTMLRIEDGELQRRTHDGGTTMRVPLDDIEEIEVRREFEPVALVFLAIAAALGAIGHFISQSWLFTAILYVIGLVPLSIGVFGITGLYIVIRSTTGEVHVSSKDEPDETVGFVNSVRLLLSGGRT